MQEPPSGQQPGYGPSVAIILTASVVIFLDQLSKLLIVERLAGSESTGRFELLPSWLALVYVENRGAAFGIFQGYSDLVLVFAVLLVIGITVTFYRMSGASPLLPFATGLIVGGAIGNIVDRVRLGFVVDFVAVGPWPKFNVADSAVSVGVVLMIIAMLFVNNSTAAGQAGGSGNLRQVRD